MRWLIATVALSAACGPGSERAPDPPRRRCGLTVWHKPSRPDAQSEVRTSWESWSVAHPMNAAADGWRAAILDAPRGEQRYAIVEDAAFLTDPTVGTTAFATIDGELREVTWVEVGGCDAPAATIEEVATTPTGGTTIRARFLAARAGDPVGGATVTFHDGRPVVAKVAVDAPSGAITVTTTLPAGKHRLRVRAHDRAGRAADDVIATAWIEPRAWDWRDAVIYQVMVDRYRGDGGAQLASPSPISARAGGTIAGVTHAIESGALGAMGVNVVWLSPLYDNPSGTFAGLDGRPYSSYHGYWPVAARALEPTIATIAPDRALDAMIANAHAHGMRVVFDVVPNHVHQEHPYAAEHPEWFHGTRAKDGTWIEPCVCGSPKCPWGEHSLDCWFTPYMPDVDWRNLDAARTFADDVAWWIDRFDGDGVRIDAVPLMPRAAIRRIADRIRRRFDHETRHGDAPAEAARTLILGEIFTGSAGYDALRFFLGPYGLDSAFEFPLMWSLRGALADRSAPMRAIDDTYRAGEAAFAGSGGVISLILGNHDVPRFASVAAGDGGRDGWDPAPQPTDPALYDRMAVAFGILFAVPGMPTVYYGDEVGLAGGGDPDSRRVMPRQEELSAAQKTLRDRVRAMGKARGCLPALRRGTYRSLASDAERVVFAREQPGADPVIVVATRSATARLEAPLPGVSAGTWVDVLSGAERSFDPGRSAFEEPSGSVRWYVPRGSACAR